jgi:phage tail protein X
VGCPDLVTIDVLCGKFYANAMAVLTELSSSKHGHLALIMMDADYLALPDTMAYITPINPRVQVPPATGATAVQIT